MSNLKALPWEPVKYAGGAANDAQGAGIYYRAIQRDGKHIVCWVDSMGGSDGDKSFDSWDELKDWVETTHYPHKMQPYVVPDSITDIANWFKAAKPEPTDRDIGTQTGCLLEEVVELLEGFGFAKKGVVLGLHNLAGLFKADTFGGMIAELTQDERIEIVDACCDINVTSVGVMQLLGGVDVLGAQREVIRSNNSKMVKGKFQYDENGKMKKGESYSAPDLTPFVSNMQNLHKGE